MRQRISTPAAVSYLRRTIPSLLRGLDHVGGGEAAGEDEQVERIQNPRGNVSVPIFTQRLSLEVTFLFNRQLTKKCNWSRRCIWVSLEEIRRI